MCTFVTRGYASWSGLCYTVRRTWSWLGKFWGHTGDDFDIFDQRSTEIHDVCCRRRQWSRFEPEHLIHTMMLHNEFQQSVHETKCQYLRPLEARLLLPIQVGLRGKGQEQVSWRRSPEKKHLAREVMRVVERDGPNSDQQPELASRFPSVGWHPTLYRLLVSILVHSLPRAPWQNGVRAQNHRPIWINQKSHNITLVMLSWRPGSLYPTWRETDQSHVGMQSPSPGYYPLPFLLQPPLVP